MSSLNNTTKKGYIYIYIFIYICKISKWNKSPKQDITTMNDDLRGYSRPEKKHFIRIWIPLKNIVVTAVQLWGTNGCHPPKYPKDPEGNQFLSLFQPPSHGFWSDTLGDGFLKAQEVQALALGAPFHSKVFRRYLNSRTVQIRKCPKTIQNSRSVHIRKCPKTIQTYQNFLKLAKIC